MRIAQQLYEGIELGKQGAVGLITYMRTDSCRVAPEALASVREYIQKNFGKEYLPDEPNVYKAKKSAQEAHEAIRPTNIWHTPQSLRQYLDDDQYKLYSLIYKRFVASQMLPAVYLVTSVDIYADEYEFSATGRNLIFDGFTRVYEIQEEEENNKKKLPKLKKGDELDLLGLVPEQHFTKPKPRYSESSLVKALEEEGVGRPSTYAPIISTLLLRDYVRRIKGYLQPTELGFKVNDLLVEFFPKIMDIKFTAHMEEELDQIEEGKIKPQQVLLEFYQPFQENLKYAQENIKKEVIPSDQICDKCGKPMVVKWGRRGKFLSCSDYPHCKNSKSISSGVKCPEPGCGGELIERPAADFSMAAAIFQNVNLPAAHCLGRKNRI